MPVKILGSLLTIVPLPYPLYTRRHAGVIWYGEISDISYFTHIHFEIIEVIYWMLGFTKNPFDAYYSNM